MLNHYLILAVAISMLQLKAPQRLLWQGMLGRNFVGDKTYVE